MDPYFLPILISSSIVVLLNTFLSLPIVGFPMISYIVGGVVAVMLFRSDKIKATSDEFYLVKVWDAAILGIASGVIVGSVLTFIMVLNLQNPEAQQIIVDAINKQMKMTGNIKLDFLDQLGPSFYVVFGIVTIILTSAFSLFGSVISLAFFNKAKK